MITIEYFKRYRKELGFTNQMDVKKFFAAKDITPTVDFNYIELLNERLMQIIIRINLLISKDISYKNIDDFCLHSIENVFKKLKNNNIIQKLNNQGDVNWITRQQMEGQTVFNIDQNYFLWKLTEKTPNFDDIFIG